MNVCVRTVNTILNINIPKQNSNNIPLLWFSNLGFLLHFLKLKALARKQSQKEWIVFQPSIFRCKLLVSGRIPFQTKWTFLHFSAPLVGLAGNIKLYLYPPTKNPTNIFFQSSFCLAQVLWVCSQCSQDMTRCFDDLGFEGVSLS